MPFAATVDPNRTQAGGKVDFFRRGRAASDEVFHTRLHAVLLDLLEHHAKGARLLMLALQFTIHLGPGFGVVFHHGNKCLFAHLGDGPCVAPCQKAGCARFIRIVGIKGTGVGVGIGVIRGPSTEIDVVLARTITVQRPRPPVPTISSLSLPSQASNFSKSRSIAPAPSIWITAAISSAESVASIAVAVRQMRMAQAAARSSIASNPRSVQSVATAS